MAALVPLMATGLTAITSGFSPSPRSTCECTAMRLAETSSEKLVTIRSRKQPSSACIKDDLRRQRHGRSASRGRVVVPAHVEGERVDRFELTIWRVSASGPMSAIRNSLMRRTRCAPGRGRTRNLVFRVVLEQLRGLKPSKCVSPNGDCPVSAQNHRVGAPGLEPGTR